MRSTKDFWKPDVETLHEEQIASIRNINMKANVQYAYRQSPYYKKLFDSLAIKPEDINTLEDYRNIPWITKSEIIENQRKNPPFGEFLAVNKSEISRIYVHPGPECFALTAEDLNAVVDNMARAFYTCGVRKEDVVDVTLNYNWVFSGTIMDEAFRKIGCAVIPGGVGMSKLHVQCMQDMKTTVIVAFPSFFERIGMISKDLGINPAQDLALRIGLIAGELRTEESKANLEKHFGLQVREGYGGSEVGGSLIASECQAGDGAHIFSEYIWELIDPQTEQTIPYDQTGELVITGHVFKSMPFLRYRTGDLIQGFNLNPCSCGRTAPRIRKIIGRVSDIPRVKGIFVIPKQIGNSLAKFDGLGRFQLDIKRPEIQDLITLKVECDNTLAGSEGSKIKNKLEIEMKEVTRLKMDIDLVAPGSIPENAKVVNDTRKI